MKMTANDYAALKTELKKTVASIDPEKLAAYAASVSPERLHWTLMHRIADYYERFIKPFYDAGLNDSHINTALRKACKEIGAALPTTHPAKGYI